MVICFYPRDLQVNKEIAKLTSTRYSAVKKLPAPAEQVAPARPLRVGSAERL